MGSTPKRVTVCRVLFVLLVMFLVFVALDFLSCHTRNRRAMAVVSNLHGRVGSLLGWPFGKEYIINFTRPLTGAELEQLSVLNSLTGRDYVTVSFNCDLTPQQLKTAQRVLSDCRVYQPDLRFRESRVSANKRVLP